MNESLIDIETVTLRCRSEQSKIYISDAVLCYRSGAYRATIVSVWIAVIFDLIDKIRELANSEDNTAKIIWGKYEAYIKQIEDGNDQGIRSALEFERELIAICRKEFQFFDQQQIVDLERLREDRHRCAHPSYQRAGEPYRPTAEQARLHLVNAVQHVLSQPPVQGKSQLNKLVAIVSSEYFPIETEKAVERLKVSALGRANDALVKGFIDLLIFDYFRNGSPIYWKEQAISALKSMIEIYSVQAEKRIERQFNRIIHDANDTELGRAIYYVASIPRSWVLLEQTSKEIIKSYITKRKEFIILPILSKLSDNAVLSHEIEAAINTLTIDQLHTAINFDQGKLRNFCKSRALELLSKVSSFTSANAVIYNSIVPLFDLFSKDDWIKVISFPQTTGADLVGATAYSTLIEKIRNTHLFTQSELNDLLRNNRAEWLIIPDPDN